MGAPDDAKPIWKENAAWLDCDWQVTCPCGWHGCVYDLLGVDRDEDDTNTMWCPQCKTTGWFYD